MGLCARVCVCINQSQRKDFYLGKKDKKTFPNSLFFYLTALTLHPFLKQTFFSFLSFFAPLKWLLVTWWIFSLWKVKRMNPQKYFVGKNISICLFFQFITRLKKKNLEKNCVEAKTKQKLESNLVLSNIVQFFLNVPQACGLAPY